MGGGLSLKKLVITGASGFLGSQLVTAAKNAGAQVIAIRRKPIQKDQDDVTWYGIDLGSSDAVEKLAPALDGADAVLHAAGSFAGDEDAHARDTLQTTEHLISAAKACPTPPKMVLVSSFSVYDVPALQDFALLAEGSPVIDPEAPQSAYARAKREQEILIEHSGLEAVTVRPGAIYGPHRLWSAQLGFAKFGRVFCPGGDALMPAIAVTHAAQSLVAAALRDLPAQSVINLLDPNPPTQGGWLAALGMKTFFVSRARVLEAGARMGRGPQWTARFKPLTYDTRRAQELLGHAPDCSFQEAIKIAKSNEGKT